jgi:hypothetical protein
MGDPVGEIRYSGEIHVRPYRRGTYLGDDHLETLIEQALGAHYSFGRGWEGHAVVSIEFHDSPGADEQ